MILYLTINDQVELSDMSRGLVDEVPADKHLSRNQAQIEFNAGDSVTGLTSRWSFVQILLDARHDKHEKTIVDREKGDLVFWRKCPLKEKWKFEKLLDDVRKRHKDCVNPCRWNRTHCKVSIPVS